MSTPCLERQGFDSNALGLDFYRAVRLDVAAIRAELAELAELAAPFMADAKVSAKDTGLARELMRLGFIKICVQHHFVRDLAGLARRPEGEPVGRMAPTPQELDRHAGNFTFNRMRLDPFVLPEIAFTHQRRWIANSLRSDEVLKCVRQSGFVSFKTSGQTAVVDLVSVPDSGLGTGSAILADFFGHAARQGLTRAVVTTEAENLRACRFYMKNGFTLAGATCVFHLHQGERP